mmetsp:Transcript_8988/g.23227  ORF Transcript_8988/g.23227 Transcript_8988/m.23227 type:complete len:290 (+) Transcript_8988:114-983(+)
MNVALLQKNQVALDGLYAQLRAFGALAISGLGAVFVGMLGSILYPTPPGVGAIAGCILGFVLGMIIGCFATGFFWDLISQKLTPGMISVRSAIPHTLAVKTGTYGNFGLILTVHEVAGVKVQGMLPWQNIDTYVEIECGGNPIKRTCVKTNGKFNQQFKLNVCPVDENILLRVKDQDIFGSLNIGYVCIDILKDIIRADFPKHVEFDIEADDHDHLWHVPGNKAAVIVSFEYTDSYPPSVRPEKTAMNTLEKGAGYGATQHSGVDFLSSNVFNPHSRPLGVENRPKTTS